MEIENGAFAKKEVFWVSGSGFPAEADVVVEIDGVEPRLDVFASLGVLPNVFGKKGQSFAITFRSPLFHVTGPGFDFPRGARRLVINTDKHAAYPPAIVQLKTEGALEENCGHRPVQYLNNVLEQDHRAIKRRINASQHFRSFWGAWRTIAGYEAVHMIRKGQACERPRPKARERLLVFRLAVWRISLMYSSNCFSKVSAFVCAAVQNLFHLVRLVFSEFQHI